MVSLLRRYFKTSDTLLAGRQWCSKIHGCCELLMVTDINDDRLQQFLKISQKSKCVCHVYYSFNIYSSDIGLHIHRRNTSRLLYYEFLEKSVTLPMIPVYASLCSLFLLYFLLKWSYRNNRNKKKCETS